MFSLLLTFAALFSTFLIPPAFASESGIDQFYSSSNADVYLDLLISNQIIDPDNSGVQRVSVLANNSLPGPPIIANKGDTIYVNVTNQLFDSRLFRGTSIHWHGIHMQRNNEYDGAVSVTQCPLVPNESFVYHVPLGSQAGTFWYHSHMATQYCDGLRGPLVIKDPHDPHQQLYDIDDESTIITVGDWFHFLSPEIILNATLGWPASILINGLGRFTEDSSSKLSFIRAQPGKRHRYRLINMGCNPAYRFSMDNHTMTIIEADGVETEPLEVDQLEIHAGQRYSVIVNANQPIDTYWIRAIAVDDTGEPRPGRTPFPGKAILRYDGAPATDPTTQPPANYSKVLNEGDLHPLINPGAPSYFYGPPDINLTFASTRNESVNKWLLDNTSYCGPSFPILLQIVNKREPLEPAASIIRLPLNKTIQISFPAEGEGNYHPFHLHGHVFDVVRVAGSSEYNYINPVRRDTVNSGLSRKNDNVTIQFRTDNSGPWLLHCHIDWHLEGGMAVVFAEDIANVEETSPDWNALCPIWNETDPDKHLPKGGGCA